MMKTSVNLKTQVHVRSLNDDTVEKCDRPESSSPVNDVPKPCGADPQRPTGPSNVSKSPDVPCDIEMKDLSPKSEFYNTFETALRYRSKIEEMDSRTNYLAKRRRYFDAYKKARQFRKQHKDEKYVSRVSYVREIALLCLNCKSIEDFYTSELGKTIACIPIVKLRLKGFEKASGVIQHRNFWKTVYNQFTYLVSQDASQQSAETLFGKFDSAISIILNSGNEELRKKHKTKKEVRESIALNMELFLGVLKKWSSVKNKKEHSNKVSNQKHHWEAQIQTWESYSRKDELMLPSRSKEEEERFEDKKIAFSAAYAYYKIGKLNKALEILEKIKTSFGISRETALLQIKIHLKDGNHTAAWRYMHESDVKNLFSHESNFFALKIVTVLKGSNNDYKGAFAVLEKSLENFHCDVSVKIEQFYGTFFRSLCSVLNDINVEKLKNIVSILQIDIDEARKEYNNKFDSDSILDDMEIIFEVFSECVEKLSRNDVTDLTEQ